MTKRPPRVDATRIGSKKIEFQLKLRNRFETLHELDDIDTMSETITYIIQQSASRVAKATEYRYIEDITTHTSPDDETTRNRKKTKTINNE